MPQRSLLVRYRKQIASFTIVIGLFVVTLIGRIQFENKSQTHLQVDLNKQTIGVVIKNQKLTAMIADTNALRQQGLSGTSSLGQGEAMLFVFDRLGIYPFWMKDMHYSIDIIWLDEKGGVVFIKEHATPESYPEQFTNTTPAKYILEVVDGFVSTYDVKVGDGIEIASQ